ncbi:MAG: hypothetical protein AAFP04_08780 [Myxococcota bacterium]
MTSFALLAAVALATPTEAAEHDGFESSDPCRAELYALELRDYLRFGDLVERSRREHCALRHFADAPFGPGRIYRIGRTPLLRLRLFEQEFGLNIDVVVQRSPGMFNATGFDVVDGSQRDRVFATPSLDLPESWDRVIDQAATPAVVVGGAALVSAIVVQMLRRR